MTSTIDKRLAALERQRASGADFTGLRVFDSREGYVAWCADQGIEVKVGSSAGSTAFTGLIVIGPGVPIPKRTSPRGGRRVVYPKRWQ